MSPIQEERDRRAVRAALDEFEHGVLAADWLGRENPALGGRAPLLVARESAAGLDRVLGALELRRAQTNNIAFSDFG